MNPDVPSRVRDAFHAALAHSPQTRHTYLEEICQHDRALFDEVAHLLRLHESIESEDPPGVDEFPGQRVGPYQVLRLIGSGGMGRVYLARRADGTFDRDVAIKVIDPHVESGDLVARFEQERRILGSLNHSSIARLIDAGRTDSNHLYFVMEYVDGVSITEYCERHGLSLRDRVALFVRVCDAVADAHLNLVVHRDLKPGNILVDSNGVPKLLDFGIAKPITRSGLEGGESTQPQLRRATPAYASPEQLQGAAAQTGMDVFSLGVILHEIVTGRRPVQASADATTTSGGDGFLKPSQELARRTGTNKSDNTDRLSIQPRDLVGDLDAIVLKALARDPARRYRSVEALATDLHAYLTHRPVSALPQSWTYRAGKTVRRNPALASVSAAALIAVVVAIAGLARLWIVASRDRDAADEQLQHVRTLVGSVFALDSTLGDLPGATAPRRQLADAISTYLSRVRIGGDRALALETAEAYRRLGDIQGNPNGPNLGESASAIASYTTALTLLGPIQPSDAGDVAAARARTHAALGDVFAVQRSFDPANEHYAQALAAANLVKGPDADRPAHRALLAGIHRPLGDLQWAKGNAAAAKAEYDQALAIDLANATQFPNEAEYQRLLALTYFRTAAMSAAEGIVADARTGYQRAAGILTELSARGDSRVGLRREVAFGRVRLGVVLEADGDKMGRGEIAQAIDELRALHDADRANVRARRDLMSALVQFADAIRGDDQRAALAAFREARQLALTLPVDPADDSARSELSLIDRRLAETAAGTPVVDLKLFRQVNGRRILVHAGDPPPKARSSLVATATAAPGWSRYLLTFGAEGAAELHEERELGPSGWAISISGPPPAQTVLLLASPGALTDTDKQRLIADIDAIPGPRVIDSDSQIIWTTTTDTVETTTTARGFRTSPWMSRVRECIARLGSITLAGRTFPLAPADER